MTDPTKPALGLSVGATTLAAVTEQRSVTRAPVVTLPGLVVSDVVDRVGDPVGIVAADGSVHHAEMLLADALRALSYAATEGRPLPPAVAITYPAHWRPAAVEALRRAIRRIPEWSAEEPALIPDVAAALTALTTNPGLPTRGVIAVCDFGGSGTSLTLIDGGSGAPVAPTLRHLDFSGDLVDQGLLVHVIAELSAGATLDVTGTSAIGSLTQLRAQCRAAKERLSTATVTALPADLPGFRGDVRLTRTELDAAVTRALAEFVCVLQDTMARAGVRPADLAAVASIGGAAAIPAITTTLSEHLRVPVITTGRPGLIGAIGAALRAARGPADDSATALAPAPVVPAAPIEPAVPAAAAALAWSEAPDVPELASAVEPPAQPVARPVLDFEPAPPDLAGSGEAALPWYRRPMPVVAAALLVIVGAGAGTAVALSADNSPVAPVTPTPSISSTPQAAPAPAAPSAEPSAAPVQNQAVQQATQVPQPRTVVQAPAPVTQTQIVQAPPPPPVTADAPPPVTETQTTTVVSTEVSTPPPVTETATVTPSPAPTQPVQPPFYIPPIPTIPPIPGLAHIIVPPPSG
ncbi:Hsp70 family protein [Mycobacterium sp. shizuoka-1]|uniref:Hsp70 family protein n=1 Tax=Mycobacterium sp. shizuoka-1 TaxID=2039281 RepID=UPI000C0649DD|nr:Hsp70 family protein [Mycobacterium sp. shizuoka-1]GAY17079.1 hypothetical protein MSZK_38050 [Mycobacterium sp. shizuoka-1]